MTISPRVAWLAGAAVVVGFLLIGRTQARRGVDFPVVFAAPDTLRVEYSGIGTLVAAGQTDVSAEVAGRLLTVLVAEGDPVTAGMLMAEIVPDIRSADPEILAGSRAQADARVASASASLEIARLAFARQQALAAQESAPAQFVSPEMLEQGSGRVSVAAADLQLAHAARRELQGQQRNAKAQDARSRVLAPRDGVVLERFHEVGEIVVPATFGGDIGRLFTVGDPTRGRVLIPLPEALALALTPSSRLRVRLQANTSMEWTARLIRVRPRDGTSSSGGLRFEADIGLDGGGTPLPLGATLIVDLATPPVVAPLTLPLRVVVSDPSGADQLGVFVNTSGLVAFHPLVFGRTGSRSIEVLSGLTRGQAVLDPSEAPPPVLPGQRIRQASP